MNNGPEKALSTNLLDRNRGWSTDAVIGALKENER
jgi:hypothetical protein